MGWRTFNVVKDLLRTLAADLFKPPRGAAQVPLELHLTLTLYQLRCDGNAARLNAVAACFGVSPGAVVNTTRLVLTGLTRLASLCVRWPIEAEHETMARYEGA